MIITEEQIQEIIRCRDDVEYFLENYFVVDTLLGPRKMVLRDKEKAVLRALQENSKLILEGDRAVGKTTLVTAFFMWCSMFNFNKTHIILAHRMDAVKDIIDICQLAIAHLPSFIMPRLRSTSNRFRIEFENGSILAVETLTSSSCKGRWVNRLFIDEYDLRGKAACKELLQNMMPTIAHGGCLIAVTSCEENLPGFRRHDYAVPSYQVSELVTLELE